MSLEQWQQEVVVPLSEHEQRVLEQMEQAMQAEDPKFATTMEGASLQARQRRRYLVGGVGVVVGLALVLLGVAGSLVVVAVLGFVVMVGAGAFAATPPRRRGPIGVVGASGQPTPRKPHSRAKSSGTFIQRLEQRWDRRRQEGRGWQ
ncbi:MAG: DUF3040 domain-containing protein [Actinomycetota bacterium]